VGQWLVLPGEEHDFMNQLYLGDALLRALSPLTLGSYFVELNLPRPVVEDWLALH
jgi:hypothetical protein